MMKTALLAACLLATTTAVQYEDVAFGKPVYQSSIYSMWDTTLVSGIPNRYPSGSFAVDGNDLTWVHTDAQINPRLTIDLGAEYDIQTVRILNRQGACASRLFETSTGCNADANGYVAGYYGPKNANGEGGNGIGAYIMVSNEGPCVAEQCPGTICGRITESTHDPEQIYEVSCPGTLGRYVTLLLPSSTDRILHVRELQALIAPPTDAPTGAPTSAPTGAPTTGSFGSEMAAMDASDLGASISVLLGQIGDTVYKCGYTGGAFVCQKNVAGARGSWELLADNAETADIESTESVTVSDGVFTADPLAVTFESPAQAQTFVFPHTCDCA